MAWVYKPTWVTGMVVTGMGVGIDFPTCEQQKEPKQSKTVKYW